MNVSCAASYGIKNQHKHNLLKHHAEFS